MLTVACVHVGDWPAPGWGAIYVERLRSMVERNLRQPHQFVVVGGDPSESWWAKVRLFQPGLFAGRVLYLDLDSVITGGLDELADTKGIIHLTDWGWRHHSYGSGVMVWDAGEHAEIFTRFSPEVPRRHRGDQDWITELGGWPALSPVWLRSYRYHCKDGPPGRCKVVSFHGKPKNHELPPGHWIYDYWK